MSAINYGPLGDNNALQSAKDRLIDSKKKKGSLSSKNKVQAGTTRVSNAIAKGSFSVAKNVGILSAFTYPIGLVLLPVSLSAAVVGIAALGVQAISGKHIDISKDKMKMTSKEFEQNLSKLSKTRIDKNVKTGVIDEETGGILKTLKAMSQKITPKNREAGKLQQSNALIKNHLNEIQSKEDIFLRKLKSSKNPNEIELKLKSIETDKKAYLAKQEFNNKKLEALSVEIEKIKEKHTETLKNFAKAREEKIKESQDKKLLKLEKGIDKKYKKEGKITNEFFDKKYATYVKQRRNLSVETKDQFIQDYYKRKGIDL